MNLENVENFLNCGIYYKINIENLNFNNIEKHGSEILYFRNSLLVSTSNSKSLLKGY